MAETELDEVVSWYKEQSEDESLKFLDELDRVVRVVSVHPLIAPEIEPGNFLFRRFPFSLVYATEDDAMLLIAIAHQRREPRYWADRFPINQTGKPS